MSGRGGVSGTLWLVMMRAMVVVIMLEAKKRAASKVFHGSSVHNLLTFWHV